jgi:hypothetical protein
VQITIKDNFPDIKRLLEQQQKQAVFAASVALNKSAEWAETDIRKEMRRVFDRPTKWFLGSLRIAERATKNKLQAKVWFKDRNSVESSSDMLTPHIFGGARSFKAMERRLQKIGVLPDGWLAVPGKGAKLDGSGNMSRGQVSFILNYLGAYTEDGFNKITIPGRDKFKKTTRARRGFVLFVARPGNRQRLKPGVYQKTAFGPLGSAIKPLLIFISRADYKRRLDFFGIGERSIKRHFPEEFEKAYTAALRTAR